MSRTIVEDKRKAAAPQPDVQHGLMTLGIAPVLFSDEYFRIGRLDAEQHGPVTELRKKHRKTHAFRFDARDGKIANIGLQADIEPMGEIEEARARGKSSAAGCGNRAQAPGMAPGHPKDSAVVPAADLPRSSGSASCQGSAGSWYAEPGYKD